MRSLVRTQYRPPPFPRGLCGAALAGQRVNVLVAKRTKGAWGSPAYLKSAWADAKGVVTFWTAASAAAAINVRVQWPGDPGHGVSTSGALGAYWK